MYKCSLNIGLKVSCIKRKPKSVTMDNWQEATREEHREYLKVQHALGRNPYSAQENNLQNFQKGQNQQTRFRKAKGPDTMNVDLSEARALTEEEQKALRTLGICFYCHKKGHIAYNCEKKAKQQRRDRRALPEKPQVRPLPFMQKKARSLKVEGKEIKLTKENFRDELKKLPDEDQVEILGDLYNMGF